MSRLQTPIRKNDNVLVTTGKDRGKKGRVIRVRARKEPPDRRGREPDQAPHAPEPDQEHQGRRGVARGLAPREQRAAGVPRVRRPTRVGHKVLSDGRKVRICRKCEGVVDK